MNLDYEFQTLLLLDSLFETCDTLFVTINNLHQNAKLSMDSITNSLLNEESNKKEVACSITLKPISLKIEDGMSIVIKKVVGNHEEVPSLAPKV